MKPKSGDAVGRRGIRQTLRCSARRNRLERHFGAFWKATPHPYLVLDPDLTIVDANEIYAQSTLIRPDEVAGRHVFDVFPDNPELAGAEGVVKASSSFRTALQERRPHEMAPLRYDIRDRGGRFVERHWKTGNYPVFDERSGEVALILHSATDVTEDVRRNLLIEETVHRYRNTFFKMKAIVARSVTDSRDLDALAKALGGRIDAMERAHQRLDENQWSSLALKVLLDDEIRPYRTLSNAILDGPDILLKAPAARSLAMVVHELATNAAKYGAFSKAGGRVVARWNVEPSDDGPLALVIEWREENGPRIDGPPLRKGLGSWIIRDLLRLEFGAHIVKTYDAAGFRCQIVLPMDVLEI